MLHTIGFVADGRFLNRQKFEAFGSTDTAKGRYHLIPCAGDLLVGTWYVDDMINDFKATQTKEELVADRLESIQKQGDTR